MLVQVSPLEHPNGKTPASGWGPRDGSQRPSEQPCGEQALPHTAQLPVQSGEPEVRQSSALSSPSKGAGGTQEASRKGGSAAVLGQVDHNEHGPGSNGQAKQEDKGVVPESPMPQVLVPVQSGPLETPHNPRFDLPPVPRIAYMCPASEAPCNIPPSVENGLPPVESPDPLCSLPSAVGSPVGADACPNPAGECPNPTGESPNPAVEAPNPAGECSNPAGEVLDPSTVPEPTAQTSVNTTGLRSPPPGVITAHSPACRTDTTTTSIMTADSSDGEGKGPEPSSPIRPLSLSPSASSESPPSSGSQVVSSPSSAAWRRISTVPDGIGEGEEASSTLLPRFAGVTFPDDARKVVWNALQSQESQDGGAPEIGRDSEFLTEGHDEDDGGRLCVVPRTRTLDMRRTGRDSVDVKHEEDGKGFRLFTMSHDEGVGGSHDKLSDVEHAEVAEAFFPPTGGEQELEGQGSRSSGDGSHAQGFRGFMLPDLEELEQESRTSADSSHEEALRESNEVLTTAEKVSVATTAQWWPPVSLEQEGESPISFGKSLAIGGELPPTPRLSGASSRLSGLLVSSAAALSPGVTPGSGRRPGIEDGNSRDEIR